MACLGPLPGSHKGMVKVSASAGVSMGKGSASFWAEFRSYNCDTERFYQWLPRARRGCPKLLATWAPNTGSPQHSNLPLQSQQE